MLNYSVVHYNLSLNERRRRMSIRLECPNCGSEETTGEIAQKCTNLVESVCSECGCEFESEGGGSRITKPGEKQNVS